jgi:large subunit ribosomal protein L25
VERVANPSPFVPDLVRENHDMQLIAKKRDTLGKATRRIRHEGRLPAVIYGDHTTAAAIEVDMHEFERVYARSGRTQLIDLVIESGRPHKVLVKEVQISPRRSTFVHVDFHQVSLRERMQVDVPIAYAGEPELVRTGEADVLQVMHTLRVECIPTRIPEMIEVDVSGLAEVDETVRVSDLRLPDGVTAVADPEDVVAKLSARRAVEALEGAPEEAPAEGTQEAGAASQEG